MKRTTEMLTCGIRNRPSATGATQMPTAYTAVVGNKCKKTDDQTDTIVINNNEIKDLAL